MRDDAGTVEKLSKNKQKPISVENAEKLVCELKYLKCSNLTQKGLKSVFDEVILAALGPPEPPKKKLCLVLRREKMECHFCASKHATMWVKV